MFSSSHKATTTIAAVTNSTKNTIGVNLFKSWWYISTIPQFMLFDSLRTSFYCLFSLQHTFSFTRPFHKKIFSLSASILPVSGILILPSPAHAIYLTFTLIVTFSSSNNGVPTILCISTKRKIRNREGISKVSEGKFIP